MKRNCFCCEKSLKSDSDCFQSPPLNATAWETKGNYGSKLFDPIHDDRLEIYICDECLRKKAKLAYFFKVKIKKEYTDVKKFNLKIKKDDIAKKKLNEIFKKKNGLKILVNKISKKNKLDKKKLLERIKSNRRKNDSKNLK